MMVMSSEPVIEVRPPTVDEIMRVYAEGAHHVVGAADGVAVAYISFRRIDGRMWGLYHPFEPLARELPRSVWAQVFYAFRRELQAYEEPVYVLARDAESARLLVMLGLEPTKETYGGKDVWQWKPANSS